MRIALFHNYYQIPGGEDQIFELECRALRELGHEVFPFALRNADQLAQASRLEKARVARDSAHNPRSKEAVQRFLRKNRIDIGHVHNWFPLLSPSIYSAHKKAGVAVVQTLHNYRLGCAKGTFRREGSNCRECLDKSRNAALIHRCYHGSLCGTLAWKHLVDKGWENGVFTQDVDAYLCPSEDVAQAHLRMGLPKPKIHLLPNACEDLAEGEEPRPPMAKGGALYLGRLTSEKGLGTLIDAWEGCHATLRIAGPGGLEAEAFRARARGNKRISFLGKLGRAEVRRELAASAVLVFPSLWREPFGLGIIESMAAGRPVIASDSGAPAQIIADGKTGLLVPPGDSKALREAVQSLLSDPERLEQMGRAARQRYRELYQPISHARALERIYQRLLGQKKSPKKLESIV